MNFTPTNKYNLTPREIEVLNLYANGYAVKEMEYELNLTYRTIQSHTRNILEKTKATTKTNALAKYLGYLDWLCLFASKMPLESFKFLGWKFTLPI